MSGAVIAILMAQQSARRQSELAYVSHNKLKLQPISNKLEQYARERKEETEKLKFRIETIKNEIKVINALQKNMLKKLDKLLTHFEDAKVSDILQRN